MHSPAPELVTLGKLRAAAAIDAKFGLVDRLEQRRTASESFHRGTLESMFLPDRAGETETRGHGTLLAIAIATRRTRCRSDHCGPRALTLTSRATYLRRSVRLPMLRLADVDAAFRRPPTGSR